MSRRSSWSRPSGACLRKRTFDILISTSLAILSSPLVLFAIIAVGVETRGNPIFRQERVGLQGRSFTLYKIRTMMVGNESTGQVWASAADVTRVGSILRRLKIDELPQLWNVAKGEMSLVGPRPCLPETAAVVDKNGMMRFEVRPGLTGLAQVSGNISLSWEERWLLDREYVENHSFALDFKIILSTFGVVLRGESWVPAP